MMLVELRALLSYVDKLTRQERLSGSHPDRQLPGQALGQDADADLPALADLYALDPSLLVFRALRFFWQRDVDGQPLLAALVRILA
jgi:hypothetical protein